MQKFLLTVATILLSSAITISQSQSTTGNIEGRVADPNGAVVPANYLNVDASPTFATGQSALANTWRDAVEPSSLLPALVAENARAGAAMHGDQQLLAMVSVAEIPLPDPAAYRRDWQHYRIRLSFGTPPGPLENRELAAPAPLPPEPPPGPPSGPSPQPVRQ